MIKYIKKILKKQRLLRKYKHKVQDISTLIEIVGREVYEKHYLSKIFYDLRCYRRLKKL
jgi:hypothetical protein